MTLFLYYPFKITKHLLFFLTALTSSEFLFPFFSDWSQDVQSSRATEALCCPIVAFPSRLKSGQQTFVLMRSTIDGYVKSFFAKTFVLTFFCSNYHKSDFSVNIGLSTLQLSRCSVANRKGYSSYKLYCRYKLDCLLIGWVSEPVLILLYFTMNYVWIYW